MTNLNNFDIKYSNGSWFNGHQKSMTVKASDTEVLAITAGAAAIGTAAVIWVGRKLVKAAKALANKGKEVIKKAH